MSATRQRGDRRKIDARGTKVFGRSPFVFGYGIDTGGGGSIAPYLLLLEDGNLLLLEDGNSILLENSP